MGTNKTKLYEEDCELVDPEIKEDDDDGEDDAETGEIHLTECRRALG